MNGDGKEDKNYNRIQTDRQKCTWDNYGFGGYEVGWYQIFYHVIRYCRVNN